MLVDFLVNNINEKMSDNTKVNSEISSSSVDSSNTDPCSSSSKSSASNEIINSIKFKRKKESASGFSTPPSASADTCDSGFTEFLTNKLTTLRNELPQKIDSSSPTPGRINEQTCSDWDSDESNAEEIFQMFNGEDSSASVSDVSSDSHSIERMDLHKISNRWMHWCQRQVIAGVNPRMIIEKIFRNGELPVPPGISDGGLWRRIASFVSQPPERTRLHNINSIDHVIGLLNTCKNIIVLTGAGVSVSCGIPDFRSRSGIYQRLRSEIPEIQDPHEIFDIRFFSKDPRPFFKFAKELFPGSFTPSLCHRFIRLLESKNKLLRNYSQNIDTLEMQTGIKKVVECHGSFATASCTSCNIVVSAEEIREDVLSKRIPMCAACNPVSDHATSSTDNPPKRVSVCATLTDGYKELYEKGILKPNIVFFGESLPENFHPAINEDRLKCDLLLVIGSSLKVRPVSLIPEFLKPDVPQILINRERVENYVFDIELLGDADVIVNELCHLLGNDWTDICEQPKLTLSTSLEFDPETTETINLPRQKTGRPTCISPSNFTKESLEPLTCSTQMSRSACDENNKDVDDAVSKTTKTKFVFSVENISSGSYYLSKPNKYVFPGSTYTWCGSGDPNKDEEEEIYINEDEEVVIGYEDYDDVNEGEMEDSLGENEWYSPDVIETSENDDNTNDVKDYVVLQRDDKTTSGKRSGEVVTEESVSAIKLQKTNDDGTVIVK